MKKISSESTGGIGNDRYQTVVCCLAAYEARIFGVRVPDVFRADGQWGSLEAKGSKNILDFFRCCL